MPALHTHPQMHPRTADLQTILTPVGRRLHLMYMVQMGTFHSSTSRQPRFYPHQRHTPSRESCFLTLTGSAWRSNTIDSFWKRKFHLLSRLQLVQQHIVEHHVILTHHDGQLHSLVI